MFDSVCQSIQDTGLLTAMRESAWVYPFVLSTHLTCIAVFGGLILLTDLRLLGVALRGASVSDVVQGLRPWKWLGFIIMVTCGLLLGGAKAETYCNNPYFQTKITLLTLAGVHALFFRRSVYRNTAELDRLKVMPGTAKLAGALSIVIWVGILSAGRWIAYYEPAKPAASVSRELAQNGAWRETIPDLYAGARRAFCVFEGLTRTKTLITLIQPPRSRILSKGDEIK
jgi:hypothetical protein